MPPGGCGPRPGSARRGGSPGVRSFGSASLPRRGWSSLGFGRPSARPLSLPCPLFRGLSRPRGSRPAGRCAAGSAIAPAWRVPRGLSRCCPPWPFLRLLLPFSGAFGVGWLLPRLPPAPPPPLGAVGVRGACPVGFRPPLRGARFSRPSCGSPPRCARPPSPALRRV